MVMEQRAFSQWCVGIPGWSLETFEKIPFAELLGIASHYLKRVATGKTTIDTVMLRKQGLTNSLAKYW